MNSNVSYITEIPVVDLDATVLGANAFLEVWQKRKLAFQTLLHDLVKRHVDALALYQKALMANARRSVANLEQSPFELMIEALAEGADPEIIELARSQADDFKRELSNLIAELDKSSKAFASLPELDERNEKTRLTGERKSLEDQCARHKAQSEADREKLDKIKAAVAALESKELQLDLSNLLPSAEQLSQLAAPGGQAKLALDTATQAMKDLEKVAGLIQEGMRYAELKEQQRKLADALLAQEQAFMSMQRKIAEIDNNLEALADVPVLMQHRSAVLSDAQKLLLVLNGISTRLQYMPIQSAPDIADVAQVFNQLLFVQQRMLEQVNRIV
ncbi:alpha-xenorhabdolysin family binary toxin subunit B [Pseudomonas sp. NPDC089428]|uniref:alpha-xenorhabdolysin family binary toxin subunit B n=1 Tax=Pseudomonas sp. NPDC089428 TaxID=3364467 RepID=UPI0037FB614A